MQLGTGALQAPALRSGNVGAAQNRPVDDGLRGALARARDVGGGSLTGDLKRQRHTRAIERWCVTGRGLLRWLRNRLEFL